MNVDQPGDVGLFWSPEPGPIFKTLFSICSKNRNLRANLFLHPSKKLVRSWLYRRGMNINSLPKNYINFPTPQTSMHFEPLSKPIELDSGPRCRCGRCYSVDSYDPGFSAENPFAKLRSLLDEPRDYAGPGFMKVKVAHYTAVANSEPTDQSRIPARFTNSLHPRAESPA